MSSECYLRDKCLMNATVEAPDVPGGVDDLQWSLVRHATLVALIPLLHLTSPLLKILTSSAMMERTVSCTGVRRSLESARRSSASSARDC